MKALRLTVLGSGTCLGPPPGALARMPPLFALEVPAPDGRPAWVLFDCSEGARYRLPAAGIDPSRVAHVAVTHPHPDHAALPQFIQGRACEAIYKGAGAGDLSLAVYLPPLAAATVRSLWEWHQPEDEGRATSRFRLDIVATPDGFAREILPGVVLRAYGVHHGYGRSPAVAFRVELRGELREKSGGRVFAYSGDTGLCEGLRRAAQGADLFVCEAAAAVGVDMSEGYGHLNPRQAATVAREAGARRVLLTHYTGLDPEAAMLDDARASGFTGPLALARDGEVVEVVDTEESLRVPSRTRERPP